MKYSLKDKVVIITGASSGIGLECAKVFAKEGAKVVLGARSTGKLESVVDELRQEGKEAVWVKADVSNENDCRNLISAAINNFGTVDVLINNAGISMRATLEKAELSVIKQVMDINFWGTVCCTKFALPYILKNKGVIVGVSSVAGYRGLPGRTGYSASKFAMQGFLEALRTEVFKRGVHIMLIAPGYTASNIRNKALNNEGKVQAESPLNENKLMSPHEVAKHMLKGIEQRKRTIILTLLGKASVFVNKWFPAFMDNMVYKKMSKEKNAPF